MGSRESEEKGAFLVITGPSGSGKTTVTGRLLSILPNAAKLLTTTTRAPRPGERDGIDYRFMTRDEFVRHLDRREFLEYAEVYGNYYGSLCSDLEGMRERFRTVIAVVDVQGTEFIKSVYPEAITIFLIADLDELRDRLEERGNMSQEEISMCLAIAKEEIAIASKFKCVVNNSDGRLDDAVDGVIMVLDIFAPE